MHLEKNSKAGDYGTRMGVTQKPISIKDISNLHPLHNVLRSFGWLYKICYHATAGHLKWSEARLDVGNRVGQSVKFLQLAKDQIQKTVKDATAKVANLDAIICELNKRHHCEHKRHKRNGGLCMA